jgi:hypothetical protein
MITTCTRVFGLLLSFTLCFVPGVSQAFTFPITFTDYWPNLTAMDAGWTLQGQGEFWWRFVRTGPGTFSLTNNEACSEQHYVFTREDIGHGRPRNTDPRIDGGVYITHAWADCPPSIGGGYAFRAHHAPAQHFLPWSWDPGFGPLADEQLGATTFLDENGVVAAIAQVALNAWTLTTIEPDGIHHIAIQRLFTLNGSPATPGAIEHFWFGDVPLCNAFNQTAKGLTRYRHVVMATGEVLADVSFCWRKP